jgi:transposase
MDAAHFVFAPFLGYLWCFTRLFIKAPCGRKRFNVLGALDAISHEMTVFTNTGYINALSVCDLLAKIAKKYCNLPVSIVLDNARYQKCTLVQEFAKSLNIELLYLPSYSPNLNLIERIWKFIKKKCLYSKYYPDFDSFIQSISSCINKTNEEYKKELDSFLSLKFQSFSKSHNMTG